MEIKKTVAICHYNTPELTEAAILSLRRHGGESYRVIVFDNSDRRPFAVKMRGVEVIDNTKGQVIDFDKELKKFPGRSTDMGCVAGGKFGSAKHMMSVQKLWDILPDGFVLMDSDVLIRKPIDLLFMPDRAVCGHIQDWQTSNNPAKIDRFMPMLLWLNVPRLKAGEAKFFDPKRCFALQPGGRDNPQNWYDTGAALLEDVRTHRNGLNGLNLSRDIYTSMFLHFKQGSWQRSDLNDQRVWLHCYRSLWAPDVSYKLGPDEGVIRGLKIYICTHRDFEPQVKHPAYEVLDSRERPCGDIAPNGLHGSFYSEILTYMRMAERSRLTKMIGFCGWRKYFAWMSDVPEITRTMVSKRIDLGKPMREHYKGFANVKDLDLCTSIIDQKHKAFSKAWHEALDSHTLHPCSMFVMPSRDFRSMMKLVCSVLDDFVAAAGDIDKRISDDPEGYHLSRISKEYQYRIGGQLGERMISAWIDWKFPDADEVGIRVLSKK